MTEPRIIDPPDRIYLIVGEIDHDVEFSDCSEVTWSSFAEYPTEIAYVRADAVLAILARADELASLVGGEKLFRRCQAQLRELVGGEG